MNEEERESGRPGGGQGRIDQVGDTGVYPLSSSEGASDDAEIRDIPSWAGDEEKTGGYEAHGDSEIGDIRPENRSGDVRPDTAGPASGAPPRPEERA